MARLDKGLLNPLLGVDWSIECYLYSSILKKTPV